MEKFIELIDKYILANRLTTINIIFGLLLAITPTGLIAFSNDFTSSPNEIDEETMQRAGLLIVGLFFLIVWIADFWASAYRASMIYKQRLTQEKKGISLIAGFGYFHIFASLALAGIIGTLLGAAFNAIAVFTPVFVIAALIKEPVLISQIVKQRKNPSFKESKSKNVLSDIVLILYAYLIFILTWQSFVYGGNFAIDFSKSSGVFMLFFVAIIYLIFYIGACWIWFEELTVSLQTKKQKLYFMGAFVFELVVVIVKLIE